MFIRAKDTFIVNNMFVSFLAVTLIFASALSVRNPLLINGSLFIYVE